MDIERKLRMKHENSSVPFAVSIHGLGGTGKSQLALRYIEMHKHEFDTVFWIDARDEESTHHCFQTFAKQLRMPTTGTHTRSSDPSASGATQYVLQWFKKRRDPDQRWLVVVDNADDVRWGVKSLIPQGVQGSIIITSQDSRSKELIDGSCEQVEVGTMESSESELLLLKHLGLHSDYISDQMRQDCVALINRLGFLAIALDLAGAFIGSRNGPREQKPRQYIRTFDEYQDEILQNEDSKGLSFTDKTVWTVWNTVLSNIDSYSSGVKPTFLLAFLAHFKGSIVQDSIFRLASLELDLEPTQAWQKGLLPQELAGLFTVRNGQWRSFQYNSTIDTLARYHLIQKIEGEQTGITMHSLVKWRALMHMPKLPWHQWNLQFLLKASSYVQKAKKDRFFPDWYISDHLLVVEDYLAAGYSWQTEARIRQIVGHIYSLMGDYSHCERVLAPVLGIFRAALLSDDVIVEEKDADVYVQALSDLASASRYHGNLDEAEELGFHALEMYAQYKGIRGSCNDPSMTETMLLSNLAVTYMEQGRFEEAQALQMASLKGDSKGQQNNQHNKLTMKANLAKTYLEQGRLEEARNLATETLKQSQALGGDDNSNTIYLMHILASSFIREGLYDEAEGILTPAFEISRRVTGSHGPWHANLMASLAEVYRKQKRYLEAKQLMTSILEIKKDTPGLLNPDTLNWTRKLAYTQLLLNESREARQLLLPVLKTSKEELGLDSPDTVELLVLLFVALIEQSQHESATDLLELPPKVWKMMWENDDFTPASLMVCVSAEHITQGRFHQAERLSSQALNLSRKALGPEHRDTFRSTENLVAALIFQGKCHLAQDLGNEALEHSDRLRGPEHPGTLLLMRYLETAFRISKVGPEYELDMLSILHHPDSTGLHIARCDW
jgi:tetratricopeptide (TPR) repeat protein